MNYMQSIPSKIFRATNPLALILCVCFTSCDAIFEDDISSDDVELTSPVDNASTSVQTQTFEWEVLDEANEYRIQIITPSFANPSNQALDSTLTGTSIVQSLVPGIYQWRVKGMNSSSETSYSIRTLTIETSEGLGNQIVVATSPESDAYLSSTVVVFEWLELDGAESYLIRFEADDNDSPGDLLSVEGVLWSGAEVDLEEGVYWWKVAGEDGTAINSQYSISRKLTIDTTAPETPELLQPAMGEVLFTSSYLFVWEFGDDLNPSHDIFEVSSTENFSTVIESIQLIETYQNIDLITYNAGEYYWRVSTFDLAGNLSESETGSFFVQ